MDGLMLEDELYHSAYDRLSRGFRISGRSAPRGNPETPLDDILFILRAGYLARRRTGDLYAAISRRLGL